ncbi:hypothetical protein [Lysinibacillus sp. NPDC056232]
MTDREVEAADRRAEVRMEVKATERGPKRRKEEPKRRKESPE